MMMKMKDSDIRKKLRASKVNSKNDILNVLETCLKEMYELLQCEKRLHEAKSDKEIVEVTFFFSDFSNSYLYIDKQNNLTDDGTVRVCEERNV